MFSADLQPCTYFGRWESTLRAVGWLEREQPYSTGDVSAEFFGALVRLLADPWEPLSYAGPHRCSLCRFAGTWSLTYGGTKIQMGMSNLFVPSGDRVLVAPSLIAHYIDAHGYYPPAEFQAAVLACPEMRWSRTSRRSVPSA